MAETSFQTAFMKAIYGAIMDYWNFQLVHPPRDLMVATSGNAGVVLFDLHKGPHPTVTFGFIADIPESSRESYLKGTLNMHSDDVFWYAVTGALETRSDIPRGSNSSPVLWRTGGYNSAFFDPLPDESSQLPEWLTSHSIVVVEGHNRGLQLG